MCEMSYGRTVVLIVIHIYGGFSWSYGLFEFIRLSTQVKKHWYSGRSLSESYQIKQSGEVLKILKPITIAFIILLNSNGSNMCLSIYLHYFCGYGMDSPLILTLMNLEYTSVATYNLYATCYMLWFFKPLRKIMLTDLARIFFVKIKSNSVAPYQQVDFNQQREDHFAYLKNLWNETPNELRKNDNYMLRLN